MLESINITPLNDLKIAIEWLTEVTHEPQEEVIRKLRQESKNLGTTVRKDIERLGLPRYRWTPELLSYYESSKSFLFESFAWNTTRDKNALRQRMGRFVLGSLPTGARVLCYGDGLGFDSAFLSLLGFDVTYYEVGGPCIEFAKRVFRENQTQVDLCSDLGALVAESFDAIVCLDVLEHVPNPPDLVSKLTTLLRKDGTFIAHAPFWYIHPYVSTHLVSNARFSGSLKEIFHANGLREIDADFFWCPIYLRKTILPISLSPASLVRVRISQFLLSWSRIWTWPTVTAIRALAKAKPRIDL